VSHEIFGNCLGIYYQSVRDLRTKQPEYYENVCTSDFDIIYLTETRLNDLCHEHNFFPNRYTVYRSYRLHNNKTRSGGVLTAIPTSLGSCKGRYAALNVYGLRFPLLMAYLLLTISFS
jgi:hypothetical protein